MRQGPGYTLLVAAAAFSVSCGPVGEPPAQVGAATSLDFDGEVLTLALDGRRIAGTVGGEPVDILFDTGAPGVGISQALAEARGLEIAPHDGKVFGSLPAYGIVYPVRPTVLDTLELGGAVFRDIPAGVADLTDADAATMRQQGIGSDVIMGLDLFRPHFRTATFDYAAPSIAFSRQPAQGLHPADITDDGKVVVDVRIGDRPARMLIDTGSKNNTVSPTIARGLPCSGYRRFERSWGSFSERLLPLSLGGEPESLRWVQVRDFATDEAANIVGVLGEINGGTLTVDLQTNAVAWDWDDHTEMDYAYAPAEQSDTCPPL